VDREPARVFEDLIVWQKSHALVLSVYRITKSFPDDEMFVLTQQLRRAAVSVPANIAEGFKRRSRVDKARLMNVAQSSLEEARYYLVLARELGYYRDGHISNDAAEVGRPLERVLPRCPEQNVVIHPTSYLLPPTSL
jgi:four helix bundle protein